MAPRGRRSQKPLQRLLDSTAPAFILDDRRSVVFFNKGCEDLTGWLADDVQGRACDYAGAGTSHSLEAVLAALAPPAEVWAGQAARAPVYVPHKTRASAARMIHFYPFPWGDSPAWTVLGVIQPVPSPGQPHQVPLSQRLHAELASVRHELRRRFAEDSLIIQSPAMQRVLQQLQVARAVESPVLIVGESGTGREHLARVLHYGSRLGRRSFTPLDSGLLQPHDLRRLVKQVARPSTRQPAVETLQPGTLFFRDIEQLAAETQQFLAETLSAAPELRVVASTTSPLERLVEQGRFRSDLFYALTSLTIALPPLRQRLEDVPLLAQFLLEERNRDGARQVTGFSDDTWRELQRYSWPGNVRELRAVVEEAHAAAAGALIRPQELPFRFRTGTEAQKHVAPPRVQPVPLEALLERVEREQIEAALAAAKQNKSRAAELLGINRPRLYRRMEQLGIVDLEGDPPAAE